MFVDGKWKPERLLLSTDPSHTAEYVIFTYSLRWTIERVLQTHTGKEFKMNEQTVWTSCARDEGGPLGIGFQERVSNHSKLLRSRAVVVSVGGKVQGDTLSRYVSERRTKVNPPKTRRYPENRRQNQERFDLLGPACREPDDWAGGDRRRGGVTLIQALVRNCRNQSLRCQGRSPSGDHHEARVPMRSTGADRSVGAVKAL
jgi:hypothetical protein